MLLYLFLLFTLLPLVELAVLIWIGSQTTWWLPVLFVIVTAVAGAALARWQGWRVVERIQNDLRAGKMPADAMIDGVLIFLAGLLLVAPGVISDALGVLLLVPPSRQVVKRGVAAWIKRSCQVRVGTTPSAEFWHGRMETRPHDDHILDVEVIESRIEEIEPTDRHVPR